MRFYKYIIIGWLVIFGISFSLRFIGSKEKKIQKVFRNLKTEFAKPFSDNVIETATTILKILSYFSKDYSGGMENFRVDSENGLREGVSYLVQSFSPVISELKFNKIEINENTAEVLLKVIIISSRSPRVLKSNYTFQIKMIKDKGKWLILSSDQV